MLIVFLVLMALFGGGAIVFFVMDAPRREHQERLRKIDRVEADLANRTANVREAERLSYEREQRLVVDTRAFERRIRDFETRTAEWNKQVITYDHLVAENGILKTDLKNLLAHMNQQKQQQITQGEAHSTATAERDELGDVYLREVRAYVEREVTTSNYPAMKKRLQAAFEQLRTNGIAVPTAESQEAFAALNARYEKALRAQAEREQQADIRERMREEMRLEREAQAARDAAAAAERHQRELQAALDRARAEAAASVAGLHASEIERLQAELAQAKALADASNARAISLAQQTRVGHVYVISNLGSFGAGIYKIGMTRRQEPMDRVIELGDASVPFIFDVHMLIKCNDAPALEKALHHEFHTKRVNKVNHRKEFFRVNLNEIVAAVRKQHGVIEYEMIQYTADAKAEEYTQGLTMTEADLAEIEEAYAEVDEELGRADGLTGD